MRKTSLSKYYVFAVKKRVDFRVLVHDGSAEKMK